MTEMFSIRLSDRHAEQLRYLAQLYGTQTAAFKVAIDLLYTLRRLEDGGLLVMGVDDLRLAAAKLLQSDGDTP